MSSFTSNILLEQLGKTDNCEIKRKFSFYSDIYNIEIIIKRGFITDLASIPQCISSIVRGSANRYWRAFVIHDALYRIGHDRKESDLILDEALKVLGMGAYARGKIYYGLRWFGSPSDDQELINNAHAHVSIESTL